MFNTLLRLLIGDTTPHEGQFFDAVVVEDEVTTATVTDMYDVESLLDMRDPSIDMIRLPVTLDDRRYVICYNRTDVDGSSAALASVTLRQFTEHDAPISRVVIVPSSLISVFDGTDTDMTPVIVALDEGAVTAI